jgi:hypothetical protein
MASDNSMLRSCKYFYGLRSSGGKVIWEIWRQVLQETMSSFLLRKIETWSLHAYKENVQPRKFLVVDLKSGTYCVF